MTYWYLDLINTLEEHFQVQREFEDNLVSEIR